MSDEISRCPFCGSETRNDHNSSWSCRLCRPEQLAYAESVDPALDKWADEINIKISSMWRLGIRDKTIEHWRKTLQSCPHHLAMNFNLGYALWQEGQLNADALINIMHSLEKWHSDNPTYWRCLAWIYFIQGDEREIEKIQASDHPVIESEFLTALESEKRPIGRIHSLVQKQPRELTRTFAASPDGRWAVSFSGHSSKLQLWDLVAGQARLCAPDTEEPITAVCFSPDNRCLLSGDQKGMIRLWESRTGREIKRFLGHANPITQLHYIAGQRFVSVSLNNEIRHWNIEGEQEFQLVYKFKSEINCLAISPDGRCLIVMGDRDIYETTFIVFDLLFSDIILVCFDIKMSEYAWETVQSFTFAVGTRAILGRSYHDNIIRLCPFGMPDGIRAVKGFGMPGPVHELQHDDFITHMQVVPFNDWCLVTITCDLYNAGNEPRPSTVWIWNVGRHQLVSRSPAHQNRVTALAMDQEGEFFATGSADGEIKLWRLRDGKLIRTFQGHNAAIRAMGLSANGLMLSCGEDQSIRLWELKTGRNLRHFFVPAPDVYEACTIEFTPDNQYACVISSDVRFYKLFYPEGGWGEADPHPLITRTSENE